MPEFLLRELRKPTARLPTDGFCRFLARVCEAPEQRRHLLLAPALRNMPFFAGFARSSNLWRTSAHVQLRPLLPGVGSYRLECFFGIEEDCDRPFIHQLHRHDRLKNSRRDVHTQISQRPAKLFVQRFRHLRWSRRNKTRPPPSTRISVQRKLRNYQHYPSHPATTNSSCRF